MTTMKRVRGLRALIEDVVEHGSRAIERVHLASAGRTFTILEHIPLIAEPARLVHTVYDASTGATYAGVRLVNRAVGVIADLVIDAVEAAPDSSRGLRGGRPSKPLVEQDATTRPGLGDLHRRRVRPAWRRQRPDRLAPLARRLGRLGRRRLARRWARLAP